MFNLYSRHTGQQQDNVRDEVTGHDRFGHVGVRRWKKSSSAPTFTPSPKWRIQREALLKQQSQAERWRRAPGLRSSTSGYRLLPVQEKPSSVQAESAKDDLDQSSARDNPKSSTLFGFSWLRQILQQLLCRSDAAISHQSQHNQADESLDQLIPTR